MDNVLTLIANPAEAILDDSTVLSVREALDTLHVETAPADWLAAAQAVDLSLGDADTYAVESCVRQTLSDAPIDIIVQKAYRRRKKLLIADMDSTIVIGETLDELAAYAGLKEEISAITQRAMRGELDFAAALYERVSMLQGLDESYLHEAMAQVELSPGAKTLV
ncbi:MAG: phosphoserine phosphatase SerB, partial [Sphingomonadales bacterium]|nr:phosphoserine phosphatase SerB [Sphingomonadales bacterium]